LLFIGWLADHMRESVTLRECRDVYGFAAKSGAAQNQVQRIMQALEEVGMVKNNQTPTRLTSYTILPHDAWDVVKEVVREHAATEHQRILI